MGEYKKLDKQGKPAGGWTQWQDKPVEGGGSTYRENTPSFESLQAKNAGQGIRGVKPFKSGQEEYSVNTKKPEEKSRAGKDAGELGKKWQDTFDK